MGMALLGMDVASSGSVGSCGIAHDCHLECPEEVWAVRRALPFPFKAPVVIKDTLNFGQCPLETVKACAMCGLHMMAEESASLSNSDFSPDSEDMLRYGCPNSP